MHPLIEQFCRIPGVANCQPSFFNRCQREFRDDVQPKLDERERLLEENETLKAQLAKVTAKAKKSEAA